MLLYSYDMTENKGASQLCKALHESMVNDSIEDHKLVCQYVYNILRKQFELDNVLQLVGNDDYSKVALLVYDCKPSELNGPCIPVDDGKDIYIEIQE